MNLAVRAMAKPMKSMNHSGSVFNQCGFDYDDETIEDYVSSQKICNFNLNIILHSVNLVLKYWHQKFFLLRNYSFSFNNLYFQTI